MSTSEASYRALLRVPTLPRVLVSMQVARVAQSMVSVALVLFTLDRYGSAAFGRCWSGRSLPWRRWSPCS
ncbi:MAG: hypothetical protein LC798_03345 [Chloroflexi bacterium]|nr:hypothetical protein [Chloroflexota bacterium]